MVPSRRFVIAVVGPTATGKSAFAEALALQRQGEIISADSMQVYRGMDIGTAKVPPHCRSVTYHCLDLVAPGERFDAFSYQQLAREAIEDQFARGKQPLVCGGTGLYVRAALDDFALGAPEQDDPAASAQNEQERAQLRQRLQDEAEALGAEAFHAKLAAIDAASASLIHPHNVRRVVRAFEWLEEGSSYAEQSRGFERYQSVYSTVFLGLDMPREYLYERINARVEQMIEEGLVDEVKRLWDEGYEQALTAQQAIGYKEIVPVLKGEESLEAAIAQIQLATRHYAKRQKSWFRRDARIHWLDARKSLDELLKEAETIC